MRIEDITVPGVVYPRFLGVDAHGSDVWELENGRWTWGEDAYDASRRGRTFEPARYIEKYGRPVPSGQEIDRKAEDELDPAEVAKLYVSASALTSVLSTGQMEPIREKTGMHRALAKVLATLDDWIQGAKENHVAGDHRGEYLGDRCWQRFAPADFRRMVNDAARELGLTEFPYPDKPEEYKAP